MMTWNQNSNLAAITASFRVGKGLIYGRDIAFLLTQHYSKQNEKCQEQLFRKQHGKFDSVQQRVEEIFSFCKIFGKIQVLEALFKPIGLPQIGCPPRGERVYHGAASRLPLRTDVVRNNNNIELLIIIK